MIEVSGLMPIKEIEFAPVSKASEIMQNLRTIITTTKYSVPLDRDFGVDADYVDKPTAVAEAMLADEIVTAIQKYEPRVTVEAISFTANVDGILIPKVQVMINGE